MSVDEILPLPGIKPPQPLDRCAIRIGQARMRWCGPSRDRIGHAIATLLPAETAADGPEMSRPRITVTTFVALSARRGARHCLASSASTVDLPVPDMPVTSTTALCGAGH